MEFQLQEEHLDFLYSSPGIPLKLAMNKLITTNLPYKRGVLYTSVSPAQREFHFSVPV